MCHLQVSYNIRQGKQGLQESQWQGWGSHQGYWSLKPWQALCSPAKTSQDMGQQVRFTHIAYPLGGKRERTWGGGTFLDAQGRQKLTISWARDFLLLWDSRPSSLDTFSSLPGPLLSGRAEFLVRILQGKFWKCSRCFWLLVQRGQRCGQTAYSQGSLATKNDLTQNVNSAKAEKP